MHLKLNRINGLVRVSNGKAKQPCSFYTASQWSTQEACFARATRVWLAVNHNTSVTSGE